MHFTNAMNVAAVCALIAMLLCCLGADLLSLLGAFVADALLGAAMPEAEGSGRSPQGVPYSELPHIINADGLHLFCRYWEPVEPPK